MSQRYRRQIASFERETEARGAGEWPVAGVDEAGRGPWAGPVVAAAVCLDPHDIPPGIADSKTLDAGAREAAFAALKASRGTAVAIAIADVDRIDRDNILEATMWAMSEAVARLPQVPRLVLVDGNRLPPLAMQARAIVGGDRSCLSIAAASIVAKVTRDRLMIEQARQHQGYGFERHKGYGTPEHAAALARLGPCGLHRRSFRPVRVALGLERSTTAARARRA